ncbi:mesencephalic astrocyte-derived neurotrophic factor-like [Halichondria panicea]|uniref:mesencephalic astrocyte-derived neurotrophic factor-like n=1 Tax=Halichondria panicea TaxID=6063 RepID=UPI00312BB450
MDLKLLFTLCLCALCSLVEAKLKEGDCEVCIGFLTKVGKSLQEQGKDPLAIGKKSLEVELIKECKKAKDKDERFCYYIGASDIAATKLINEVTKPLSYGMPPEKICEKLKGKDGEICDLKYDKEIDFKNVDLKKMRVKQLKKILINWGEDCRGCAEKTDFINKIETVMHQHVEL